MAGDGAAVARIGLTMGHDVDAYGVSSHACGALRSSCARVIVAPHFGQRCATVGRPRFLPGAAGAEPSREAARERPCVLCGVAADLVINSFPAIQLSEDRALCFKERAVFAVNPVAIARTSLELTESHPNAPDKRSLLASLRFGKWVRDHQAPKAASSADGKWAFGHGPIHKAAAAGSRTTPRSHTETDPSSKQIWKRLNVSGWASMLIASKAGCG
jgi:hypothetical protein